MYNLVEKIYIGLVQSEIEISKEPPLSDSRKSGSWQGLHYPNKLTIKGFKYESDRKSIDMGYGSNMLDNLKHELIKEWLRTSLETIHNLIICLPKRC